MLSNTYQEPDDGIVLKLAEANDITVKPDRDALALVPVNTDAVGAYVYEGIRVVLLSIVTTSLLESCITI
jgi:hypothetical protein